MFHFPTFPPHTLCVQMWVTTHDGGRVSPFGHPRIKARLAAPRGLSQPPTSFIGSWCLGIHRVPLITWPQRCSRPLCSSQATGGPKPTPTAYPSPGNPFKRRPPARFAWRIWSCPHRNPRGHRANAAPRRHPAGSEETGKPVPSGPNSVFDDPRPLPPAVPHPARGCTRPAAAHTDRTGQSSRPSPGSRHSLLNRIWTQPPAVEGQVLLRKEVIQPHLPVRLPCYDFVPIADPTFDGSLPEGLGHRLRVLPTFVT
jgi:hypothetical protein